MAKKISGICPYCHVARTDMRDHVRHVHPDRFAEWEAVDWTQPQAVAPAIPAGARVCQAVHGQNGMACEILLADNEENHAGRYHRNGDLQWTELVARYPEPPKEAARDRQVGGDHYHQFAHQPWDIIDEHGLNYFEGSALKYLLRYKGDRAEDLRKAIHCLERAIETEEKNG